MADRSTIYEVAKRSGVSTATVLRIMADGKGFSEATRERVRAVAVELGWVPNAAARGLASRRAGSSACSSPISGNPVRPRRSCRCTSIR